MAVQSVADASSRTHALVVGDLPGFGNVLAARRSKATVLLLARPFLDAIQRGAVPAVIGAAKTDPPLEIGQFSLGWSRGGGAVVAPPLAPPARGGSGSGAVVHTAVPPRRPERRVMVPVSSPSRAPCAPRQRVCSSMAARAVAHPPAANPQVAVATARAASRRASSSRRPTPRAEGAGGARVSPVTMRNDDLGRRVGRHGTAICNMNADGAVEIVRSRGCRAARGYQPRGLCRRRSRRAATATPRAEGAGDTRVSPVTMRNDDLGRRVGRHGTTICNVNADGAVEIVRSRWCRAARDYQPRGLCRRRSRRAATATL